MLGRSSRGTEEFKQLDIALKVLECAATREEKLPKLSKDTPHAGKDEVAPKLSTEYYSLRVALVSMIVLLIAILTYKQTIRVETYPKRKSRHGVRIGWILRSTCSPRYLLRT